MHTTLNNIIIYTLKALKVINIHVSDKNIIIQNSTSFKNLYVSTVRSNLFNLQTS